MPISTVTPRWRVSRRVASDTTPASVGVAVERFPTRHDQCTADHIDIDKGARVLMTIVGHEIGSALAIFRPEANFKGTPSVQMAPLIECSATPSKT